MKGICSEAQQPKEDSHEVVIKTFLKIQNLRFGPPSTISLITSKQNPFIFHYNFIENRFESALGWLRADSLYFQLDFN